MRLRSVRRLALVLGAVGVLGALVPAASAAPPPPPPPKPRLVTIFVAGDSTAATWPLDTHPKAGWGQALPVFLNPREVRVDNKALSGASSKSFITVGLFDQIAAAIRPGDYLLISFGHNDEKIEDPARGTDPATTFPEYLTRYIDLARAHHARPVLVTPVERRRFDATGHAYRSHGAYPQAMIDLGAKLHVPVVDLSTSSLNLWESLGAEGTKADFLWLAAGDSPNWPVGVSDNTHFRAHGAIDVARLVVEGLKAQHVLPPHLVTNLHCPVPESALVWPETVWQPPV